MGLILEGSYFRENTVFINLSIYVKIKLINFKIPGPGMYKNMDFPNFFLLLISNMVILKQNIWKPDILIIKFQN